MAHDRIAMVAGGSGGIGEAIVFALINRDYRVYVPNRPGDQSGRLREYVGEDADIHFIEADLSVAEEVDAMRDTIVEREGRIDAVVVSVGSYYYGHRMHRMPMADWHRVVSDNLTTHFNLQRAFVGRLRDQNAGTYLVLTGPEAETIHPDEQVMSIMAAGQRMMARVIAHEAFDSLVRVYSITARTSIKTRSRAAQANPDWIPALDLASYVAGLIRGQMPGIHETMHEIRDRAHLDSLLDEARRRTKV